MREITKTITIPVDGSPKDFRLTKLDAFSGAFLLRLLARLPGEETEQVEASHRSLARQGNSTSRFGTEQGDGSCSSGLPGTKEPSPTFRPGNRPSEPVLPPEQPAFCSGTQPPAPAFRPLDLLTLLPESDLRSLMVTCLQHAEVRLPAGWNPVMTRGEWTWPELEHDTAVCLKLTIEEVLWTLKDFFPAGGSASRPGTPDS